MQFHSFADDAASSVRRIRRHPRNFLLLLVMVAVSIGSIMGIFDVAYEVLHGKLPYGEVNRTAIANDDLSDLLFDPYKFRPNPNLNEVFEKAAAFDYLSANLSTDSGLPPERIDLAMVTPEFFSTLGIRISTGQDFSAAMGPPGVSNARQPDWLPIILSDKLWRSEFGGRIKIVGRSANLIMPAYHLRVIVIGVAPPGVSFPPKVDAWIPVHTVSFSTVQTPGIPYGVGGVIGLLQPGLSITDAAAKIRAWPQHTGLWGNFSQTVHLVSLREFLGGKFYRLGPILWLATFFFLLLAVAAALGIFQIEMETRSHEFAIRQILGATPDRLFRSLAVLTGATLLLAVTASFAVRSVLIHLTVTFLRLPERFRFGPDWIDFAMAMGVAGVVFGAAVAHQGRTLGLFRRRKYIRIHDVSRFRFPAQVIPATLILITAIMLAESAHRLMRIPLGVQARNVFVCEVALPLNYGTSVFEKIDPKLGKDEQQKQAKINAQGFVEQVLSSLTSVVRELKSEPGIAEDGLISVSPYSGYPGLEVSSYYSRTPGGTLHSLGLTLERAMTGSAVPTLGMRVIYGRNFSEGDSASDQGTVIVNLALADELGGNQSALGSYIRSSPNAPAKRIVGIVDNVHEEDLYSPSVPTAYDPFGAIAVPDVDIVVRTSGKVPSRDILDRIQASVKAIAPAATVSHFAPLSEMVLSGTEWTSYSAYFLLALAGLGVFLAGICAWAKAASEMRRREHEIGVRLTLGGTPGQIIRLIASAHLWWTLLAAAIGAVFTWWFAHLMSYLFYEVTPSDLSSYLIGTVTITGYVMIVVVWSVSKAVRRNPQDLMRAHPFE